MDNYFNNASIITLYITNIGLSSFDALFDLAIVASTLPFKFSLIKFHILFNILGDVCYAPNTPIYLKEQGCNTYLFLITIRSKRLTIIQIVCHSFSLSEGS